MIQNLISMSNEANFEKSVCQRICLCVSALALQINQDGIISEILGQLNSIIATSPLIILELLTVLPEECYDKRVYVHPNTRDLFASQLCVSVNDIFTFLNTLYLPQTQIEVKKSIILCLQNWIDNINVPEEFLINHILYQNVLNSIHINELLDEVSDIIIYTLRRYRTDIHSSVEASTSKLPYIIIPQVIKLGPLWKSQDIANNNQDDDICRTLCRLFTETAETYCYLFLTKKEFEIYISDLFSLLLECVKYPYDFDISRIPLQFFYELCVLLTDENNILSSSSGSSMSNNTQHPIYPIHYFYDLYINLLMISIQHMRLDNNNIINQIEINEEKTTIRSDLVDTISDCTIVLGGDLALMHVYNLLTNELTNIEMNKTNGWTLIESCLITIQIIIKFVSTDENEIISKLLNLLPLFPNYPRIILTTIGLIGQLASWIYLHSEYMLPILDQLMSYLANPILSDEASSALMLLMIYCKGIYNHTT